MTGQEKIVNTLTVFDANTLFPEASESSEETPFWGFYPDKKVFIVASYGDAISGNASAELNLKAIVGDVIRWRATSISDNNENVYTAEFYKFKKTSSDESVFTNPVKRGDFWEATVTKRGTESYNWYFKITNASNETRYFAWDPKVTVE